METVIICYEQWKRQLPITLHWNWHGYEAYGLGRGLYVELSVKKGRIFNRPAYTRIIVDRKYAMALNLFQIQSHFFII